jgi:hypothetical protein
MIAEPGFHIFTFQIRGAGQPPIRKEVRAERLTYLTTSFTRAGSGWRRPIP